MIHPLFADILKTVKPKHEKQSTGKPILDALLAASESLATECEHDWTVKGYSPPVPHGTLSVPPEVDAPEFVFWICRKCGTEEMEPFQ